MAEQAAPQRQLQLLDEAIGALEELNGSDPRARYQHDGVLSHLYDDRDRLLEDHPELPRPQED